MTERAALPPRLAGWRRARTALQLAREPQHTGSASHLPAVTYLHPAAFIEARPKSFVRRHLDAWRSLDYSGQLTTAIVEPRLTRSLVVAVGSRAGQSGKSTVTAALGTMLALLRRERVIAVDAGPPGACPGWAMLPDYPHDAGTVLGRLQDRDLTLTGLDALLGLGPHGLRLLPAPRSRRAAFDSDAYRLLVTRLRKFAGVVLLDCGTGLESPAARAAAAVADQFLLVGDAAAGPPAGAERIGERRADGCAVLVVVNRLRGRRPRAVGPAAVALPECESGAARLARADFSWPDAPRSWRLACQELAATVVLDWRARRLAC